jgi:hypothetical protein
MTKITAPTLAAARARFVDPPDGPADPDEAVVVYVGSVAVYTGDIAGLLRTRRP